MYWTIIVVVSLFSMVQLTSSKYTCSDCHTAAILSRGRLVASVHCSGANSYCRLASGTCSDQPDDGCEEKQKKKGIICTEDGYFPDFECTTYFVCRNKKGTKLNCPDGNVYNVDKRRCEANEKCGTFDCSNSNEIAPHSVHPQYYAKCPSTGRSPSIYKCPNGHIWSNVTKGCEAYCDAEGLIVDSDDCSKYFRCEKDYTNEGRVYRRIHEICPVGQGFDAESDICVPLPSDNLPNCVNDNIVENGKHGVKHSLANSDLFCLEDGVFPAENCNKYYSCVNNEPVLQRCHEPGEVFYPAKAMCLKGLPCGQYNCTAKGQKFPHTVFPSYYASCGSDLQPLVLGRCQSKFELDYTQQECINVCRSGEGLKPDPIYCLNTTGVV